MEYENVESFTEEMKDVTQETKYRLIIAKNGRIVLQPTVSTARKNVLFLRNFTLDDIQKIEKVAKTLSNVKVKKVLNFFFDEKREPFSPAIK